MIPHRFRAWSTFGRGALGRLAAFGAAVIAGTACANQALPPGGPPDAAPPMIVRISPENRSTAPRVKEVEVRFDEVISETPRGARDLSELVFISPRSGRVSVDWSRTRMTIRPARGWKPNTVYSVQIKAGLQDLRNNGIDTAIKLVFSTGGPIPDTKISGVAFDWPAGKPLSNGLVEAVADDRDSTTYQVVADEKGRFDLEFLPPGPYLLRAYADKNANRALDPLEIWDSLRVTLTQQASAEFYAFGRDTVGLRIASIELQDSSRALKVTFDKPYSPNQVFTAEDVALRRRDSSLVPVREVLTAYQKLRADSLKRQAEQDSIKRANAAKAPDSTPEMRARADSIARVRRADSIEAAQAAARRQRAEAERQARAQGKRYVPPDTTPPPKMNRPPVYTEIYVLLDSALAPQSQYRLQVFGVRSLSELARSPSRVLNTPRPPARDTSKRNDTTARRDTARPPAAPARRDTVRRDTLVSGRNTPRALFTVPVRSR